MCLATFVPYTVNLRVQKARGILKFEPRLVIDSEFRKMLPVTLKEGYENYGSVFYSFEFLYPFSSTDTDYILIKNKWSTYRYFFFNRKGIKLT